MTRARKTAFWTILFGIPAAFVCGAAWWVAGYLALPVVLPYVHGDPIAAYDAEAGFVPRPNSNSFLLNGERGRWNVHTDRRGARVNAAGEQTPERVDIVTIGCSFTWGFAIENEETFAQRIARALDLRVANLAFGGYGTTQSLQALHRNRDLAPKLVIYGFIWDHLRRNVALCAPSATPLCVDVAHVAIGKEGPVVRPPASNGVLRAETYMRRFDPAAARGLVARLSESADILQSRVLQAGARRRKLIFDCRARHSST